MVRVLAKGLAAEGHEVHVVTPDLDEDERRGESEWWWPSSYGPRRADVVVMVGSLAGAEHYEADGLVYATNGASLPDQLTAEVAGLVSAYPVFSRCHADLLCRLNPIPPERCVVTGLGVDIDEYTPLSQKSGWTGDRLRIPGRIWVGNDPARGLLPTLDVFDLVREQVPHATLRVTYDFDRQFEAQKWRQNAMGEMFWEMKRRLENTPGVVALGSLSREELIREQLEAQVHLWPSDPPNVGSQIHGLSQMEAAAAGCALVLSDVEAFPEVFGEAAVCLPLIGTYLAAAERRVEAADYAREVVRLMTKPKAWATASKAARHLAEKNTWEDVIGSWLLMLDALAASKEAA